MCCHCDSSRSPSDGGAAPSPDQKNEPKEPKEPGVGDGEPPKVPNPETDTKKTPPSDDGKAPEPPKSADGKNPPKTPPKTPGSTPTNDEVHKNGKEPTAEVKARFPNMTLKQYGNDVYAQQQNGNYKLIGSYDKDGNFTPAKDRTPEELGFNKAWPSVYDQFPGPTTGLYVAGDGNVYQWNEDGTWTYRGHVNFDTGKRDR